MKNTAFRFGLLALLGVVFATLALAQANATKSVEGKVFGSGDAPLSGAIVYLEDGKTNEIRSFISTGDGSYRFGELSSDTDYQLWARYNNTKSATRPVSAYDSRKRVIIDLHIKTK